MDKNNHSHMQHNHMDHKNMDHSMHMGNLKQKFWFSLILAIPIFILSPMMGIHLPFQFSFVGSDWVVMILSTALFFYGGIPFLKGAKMELKMKSPAMMTLIALGISVSYIYSLYAFVTNKYFNPGTPIMDFFWELASLILIMLLGHWIEMNAVSNAGNALQKIAELLPNSATIIDDSGTSKVIKLSEVNLDDLVLIKAGEKIPVDGIVVNGQTTVNESLVTGESLAIKKIIDDKVIGGSLNGSGTITVKVTGIGESSYLSQVMNLVNNAQKEKSRAESISDVVAKWLFYIALIVGIVSFILWGIFTNNIATAFERMVAVLVIACPHALGLAIPLVVSRSTSIAAKNGLLIKNRHALEVAKNIDIVMMDKTGTLTKGDFTVNSYQSLVDTFDDDTILSNFAALEQNSSHPLSIGIIKKAKQLKLAIPTAKNVTNIPGIGLTGLIDNKTIKIVNISYLNQKNITYDKKLFNKLSSEGNSISFLLINDQLCGLVAQGDEIKDSARKTIQKLKKQHIQPIILTGDNNQSANLVAKQLGIETVYSQLLPEDKEQLINKYKKNHHTVMMVGDGVNDAPSLARADIGIAIGAGTDVAIDSADVILVKSNPADILKFLSLAKNTQLKMIQNLWWGAGYNAVAIPLAAGILAGFGFILSPAIGAVLMSLSTIIVAINAMTLKIK